MPLVLILAVIIVVWLLLTFKARQRVRHCRWRQNHARDTPDGRYFICMNCGAEQFQQDNLPPTICLRDPQG